jgi:hypothetical protein
MFLRRFLLPSFFIAAFFVSGTFVCAAGTVQLSLVGDSQGSALSFQEWSQALAKAGIRNVRIRSGTEDDKPGIVTEGAADSRIYVVTGLITSRDELILPGARFRRGDMAKLAVWLKDLAENGPVAGRAVKSPAGLTGDDFKRVRKDLATTVEFSTVGMTRQAAIDKIAALLKTPLQADVDAARELADEKIEDELSGLSAGTALACLLRPAGFSLAPRMAAGQLVYAVVRSEGRPPESNIDKVSLATLRAWPIGWTTDKSDQEAVPELYKRRNVNVQNVPVAKVLEAISKQTRTPVLLDRKALAKYNINPAKVSVSFPSKPTYYISALRRMLPQAKLRAEVRYDDAATPFLWVTTSKTAD